MAQNLTNLIWRNFFQDGGISLTLHLMEDIHGRMESVDSNVKVTRNITNGMNQGSRRRGHKSTIFYRTNHALRDGGA